MGYPDRIPGFSGSRKPIFGVPRPQNAKKNSKKQKIGFRKNLDFELLGWPPDCPKQASEDLVKKHNGSSRASASADVAVSRLFRAYRGGLPAPPDSLDPGPNGPGQGGPISARSQGFWQEFGEEPPQVDGGSPGFCQKPWGRYRPQVQGEGTGEQGLPLGPWGSMGAGTQSPFTQSP